MGIEIISTQNAVIVTFNEYGSDLETKTQAWFKTSLQGFKLTNDESMVIAYIIGEKEWNFSFNGASNTIKIDKVNNVIPESNLDLFYKLMSL